MRLTRFINAVRSSLWLSRRRHDRGIVGRVPTSSAVLSRATVTGRPRTGPARTGARRRTGAGAGGGPPVLLP
jgi:hypothetical protein